MKWEPYNKCKKFAVQSGRGVVCIVGKMKGKELFSISKEEGMTPTEADAITRYVVDKLNKGKDFGKYYKKYMES